MDIYPKYAHFSFSLNETGMIRKEIEIANKMGLHARPATVLAKEAASFDSDFSVQKKGKRVNGKSVLELITLAAEKGEVLTLEWDGNDEAEASKSVIRLFNNNFGLEE